MSVGKGKKRKKKADGIARLLENAFHQIINPRLFSALIVAAIFSQIFESNLTLLAESNATSTTDITNTLFNHINNLNFLHYFWSIFFAAGGIILLFLILLILYLIVISSPQVVTKTIKEAKKTYKFLKKNQLEFNEEFKRTDHNKYFQIKSNRRNLI